jgi:hypothetical protein
MMESLPNTWTSNIVESPIASSRLRTEASKPHRKIDGATAMTWRLLLVAEPNFRRVKAPELMAKVADGVKYTDGIKSLPESKSVEYKQAA